MTSSAESSPSKLENPASPAAPAARPFRIAVLISGGGTTLKNLLDEIAAGRLNVEVVAVVSSSPLAGGLKFAAERAIPASVVQRSAYANLVDFSEATFAPCRAAGADLVVMGGYLKLVKIPTDFQGRVVNIHPSLIPSFCGQGFYGLKVHQAAIDYGAKVSGCTIHFVDDQYDHGPIVDQRTVPVLPDDDAATLQRRVFDAECVAYPEVIRWIASGRVRLEGRKVRVL